jgi:hypothetical protein
MSSTNDEHRLRWLAERIVDDFTMKAQPFTALDVSNAVKAVVPDARHREVSPLVRDQFARRGMGAYVQTMIDVMAGGSTPAKAYLYHLPNQPTSAYNDAMRAQLAKPPTLVEHNTPVAAPAESPTEAPVKLGKDGRGRIPRRLLEAVGITGDTVIVRSESGPQLVITSVGDVAVKPVDAKLAMTDMWFAPTPDGQPIAIEHPVLLHLPASLLAVFGAAPDLIARVEGATVVVRAVS